MVSYNDKPKAVTAEDLMRRYNLEEINRSKKAITTLNDNLTKTNANLEKYVKEVLEDISNLQDQVDGNVSTWFFSGIPTLQNNPAVDWTTEEEKANHLGDLYYDKDTGYAYRFSLENNVYSWLKLTDSDVTEALALANAAQDTADSKRRVFVTTPTPPYDVGDIWFKDNSDLYRCRASRSSGDYNEVDWIIATKYTDDSYAMSVEAVLDQFKQTVETNYATKVALETTADSIIGSVSSVTTKVETLEGKVVDVTNELNGVSNIVLNNSYQNGLLKFSLHGEMSLIYPSDDLYLSDDLYPLDSYLIIENGEGNRSKIWLPLNYLHYFNADTYDEFVIEDGNVKIIRRVGENENGSLYALSNEVVEDKGNLEIPLYDGYNKLWLESFYDKPLNYYVCYALKNDYTYAFATKIDLNSSIRQNSSSILNKVNANIEGVDEDLNAKLELKVDIAKLISEINASADVINLQSNRFSMESDYSSINQDGIVNFKGGKVGGWTIDEYSLSCDIVPPYDYSQDDVTRLRGILAGTITPTQEDYEKYDFHNDGNIDMTDLIICRRLVDNNLMNSNPGKLIFDTSDWFNPIKIVNSSGETIASFGVGGAYAKEVNEE